MDALLVALPALGCALMMVPMMWLMGRGMRSNDQPNASPPPQPVQGEDSAPDPEVIALRAEVDRLRAEMEARNTEPAQGSA